MPVISFMSYLHYLTIGCLYGMEGVFWIFKEFSDYLMHIHSALL